MHSVKMAAAGDDTENLDAPRYGFDDFWRAYPRRVARADARKAWDKVDPGEYARIFAAIAQAKQCDDWRRDGGRFIPYPGSWLRGERWFDEAEADLSMGQCAWNINGNRGPDPRCDKPATTEKRGVCYCAFHGARVNP